MDNFKVLTPHKRTRLAYRVMDEAKELVADVIERLRVIREAKGISRYRLSKKTGLSASGLRHMETGAVSPTLYFLLLIARCLEVDLAEILDAAQREARRPKGKRRL